jgi:hypothetical protein
MKPDNNDVDMDDFELTTEIAHKAARAMAMAGINAVGKAKIDDYDWNDRTLSIAVGLLLTSLREVNEAIPRIAAETYLSLPKEEKIH